MAKSQMARSAFLIADLDEQERQDMMAGVVVEATLPAGHQQILDV